MNVICVAFLRSGHFFPFQESFITDEFMIEFNPITLWRVALNGCNYLILLYWKINGYTRVGHQVVDDGLRYHE